MYPCVLVDIAITVGGAACNAVDSAFDNMPCYDAIFILRARDHVSLTSLANKSSYYHYRDIFLVFLISCTLNSLIK